MKKLMLATAALALTAGIAAAAPIRIGSEGAYPPYNLVNEAGELDGFDIAVGNDERRRHQQVRLNRQWRQTTKHFGHEGLQTSAAVGQMRVMLLIVLRHEILYRGGIASIKHMPVEIDHELTVASGLIRRLERVSHSLHFPWQNIT